MTQKMLVNSVLAGQAHGGSDVSWCDLAACLGADTELFFPETPAGPGAAEIQAAKDFCQRCPVRDRCLWYAVNTRQTAGIWGGCDENERQAFRQKRRYAAIHRAATRRRP